MKRTTKAILALVIMGFIAACGTRDYQKPPADYGQPVPPRENEPRAEAQPAPGSPLKVQGPDMSGKDFAGSKFLKIKSRR